MRLAVGDTLGMVELSQGGVCSDGAYMEAAAAANRVAEKRPLVQVFDLNSSGYMRELYASDEDADRHLSSSKASNPPNQAHEYWQKARRS